ncbi:MAG: type II toxin-antitoxin system HicA family toxin [Vulcanimicrobiaceae bacterium]
MPTRKREVIRMIEAIGFRWLREGKGDHAVYARGEGERIVLDGDMNKELPTGFWLRIQKKYGLKER